MRSRRPHKKSRRGCTSCKKRHIKCDEARPACASCHDYGLKCIYAPIQSSGSTELLSGDHNASLVAVNETKSLGRKEILQVQQKYCEISIPSQIDVLTAGRLLHHYSTIAYSTLSTIPSQQRVWQTSVVQTAFGHHFVLRGILAFSALHLARTEPRLAFQNILEATEHQQAALAEFRPMVGMVNASPRTLESWFLLSCFLTISAFAMPMAEEKNDLQTLTGVEDFLACANLARGMTAILQRLRASVSVTGVDGLSQPGLQSETLPVIRSEPSAELLALSQLYVSSKTEPCAETSFIYQRAVQVLHEQFVKLSSLPRHGDSQSPILYAITWLAIVSRDYLTLLEKREPRAVVILAYYGVLLHRLDFFWCFRGWGRHLVRTSLSLSEHAHEELLVWPRAEVGLTQEI